MTEKVQLILDQNGQLQSFTLSLPERDVSANDGSPLTRLFKGRTIEEILRIPVDRFCEDYPAEDDWPQVILMRQFLGLRAIMEWLAGRNKNENGKFCDLELKFKEDGSKVIEGEINFGYAIAKIAACKQCQGCNKNRKTLKRKK
jgi:hypothetical protein